MQAKHEMDENAYSGGQNLPTLVAAEPTPRLPERGRKQSLTSPESIVATVAGATEASAGPAGGVIGHELAPHAEADGPQNGVTEVVRKAIENATSAFQRMDASSLSMVPET